MKYERLSESMSARVNTTYKLPFLS